MAFIAFVYILLKPRGFKITTMKYKKGDLVQYVPFPNYDEGDVMFIMSFDEKRNKYKCFNIDVYDFCQNPSIEFIKEEELLPYKPRYEDEVYENITLKEDFDELYYPIYEYDKDEVKLIRKTYKFFPWKPKF